MIRTEMVHDNFKNYIGFAKKIYSMYKSNVYFKDLEDLYDRYDKFVGKNDDRMLIMGQVRRVYNYFISWPFISFELVNQIKRNTDKDIPLYNLMSGNGVISKMLNREVVNVDINDGLFNDIDIKKHDVVRYVKNNNHKIKQVLISWPPYNDEVAYRVLSVLKKGTKIIYVGEGSTGCTGDKQFNDAVEEYSPKMIWIPKFHFIHDNMYVFTK